MGKYNLAETLSGPEKFAKRLYHNSLQSSHQFLFIDFFRENNNSIWTKLFGSKIIYDNKLKIHKYGIIIALINLIREKPDIIHLVTFEMFQIVAFLYKLNRQVKVIYTSHGLIFYENLFFKENINRYYWFKDKFFEKLIYKYSDKIIFVSETIQKLFKNYTTKFSNIKFEIIPNGVDEVFFTKSHAKVKKKKGELKIVFIGDILRKEKGFKLILETLRTIDIPLELYCISENKISDVYTLLKNSKIYLYFIKPMNTSNLANFLKKIDIHVSVSIYDPFPISLLESMASGVSPILTKETGTSVLIKNGINGYILEKHDKSELKKYLVKLHKQRSLLNEISKKATFTVEKLTWNYVFDKYLYLYNKIVNNET